MWFLTLDGLRRHHSSSKSASVDPAAEGAPKGPSKNELKKREKEAEKERKRQEREAREAAARAAREAADVVSDGSCLAPSLCREHKLSAWLSLDVHSLLTLDYFSLSHNRTSPRRTTEFSRCISLRNDQVGSGPIDVARRTQRYD